MTRALGAGVLLALIAACAHANPAFGAACPDVVFLGARASGEPATGHDGVGPAVDHMAAELREILRRSGQTLGIDPILYPARPTRDLWAVWRWHPLRYFRSLDAGTAAVAQAARDAAGACPDAQLVMAGYSQGAMVVHQGQLALADAGRRDVLARVAATLLLGDGDRLAGTRAAELGSASPGATGLRPWFRAVRPRDVALPGRTADLCDAGDLVCDFALRRLLGLRAIRRAIAVHRDYAASRRDGTIAYSPLLDRAAAWAARRVGRVPRTGPAYVLSGVGVALRGWRAATGRRVDAGVALPADLGRYRCVAVILPPPGLGPDAGALAAYLRRGGTVLAVGEHGDGGRFSAGDAELDRLARALGASIGVAGDARDPAARSTRLIAAGPITAGVGALSYDWTTTLAAAPPATVLASLADGSAALLAAQAVGAGTLVVAGDSDLFTGPGAAAGNRRLIADLCP